jgi:hypothetical protein
MSTQHSKSESLPDLNVDELAHVHGGSLVSILEKIPRPEPVGWAYLEQEWHKWDPYFSTVGSCHPGHDCKEPRG